VIDFERAIGRMLVALTYVAVALLAVGVLLMVANGISPLSGGPPLDVGHIADDVAALLPQGFLWLGLIVVIATPIARVVAAGIGYARAGDRLMVVVAVLIVAVIALSVATALAFT
jgi:uncharacterized membrane protein